MSRRESRGQQVKTFQAHIPQPDLTYEKVIEKVYFQAASGLFSIYLQPHILGLVDGNAFGDRSEHGRNWWRSDRIVSSQLQPLLDLHRDVLARYTSIVREQTKTKVIVFKFECNLAGSFKHVPRNDMHFATSPAIALNYAVRWRSGGNLYTFDEEDPELGLQQSHFDGVEIEWTAERETFFEAMKIGLINAIDRLIDFEKALKVNAGKAIAQMSGRALLPAPADPDADDSEKVRT